MAGQGFSVDPAEEAWQQSDEKWRQDHPDPAGGDEPNPRDPAAQKAGTNRKPPVRPSADGGLPNLVLELCAVLYRLTFGATTWWRPCPLRC